MLSPWLVLKPVFTDFTTLTITDTAGQIVPLRDSSNNPIVGSVPVRLASSGSTASGTVLRFELGDPYTNVCLPKNTK